MHALVRVVFRRLHHLDPDAEEEKLRANDEDQEGEIKMTVSTNTVTALDGSPDINTDSHSEIAEPVTLPSPTTNSRRPECRCHPDNSQTIIKHAP